MPVLTAGPDRRDARLRLARRGRDDDRLAARDRRSTTAAAWCSSASGSRSSTSTSRAASARRAAWARAGWRRSCEQDRGRATATQADLDLLLDVCDRILGKCLCPLGDAAAMPVASYIDKFRDEFQRTSTRRLPDSAASRRSRACSPRSTSTRTHPVAEVAGVSADASRDSSRSRSTTARSRSPKGTGLVETAAAAGIEIPVFCYEPRLGPAVGACRMCLVEVEGLPKLQAGCTLTAQDGMVVRTAQTSREGGRGPERDARVHPRQPPARLPGLRQGRRVPAPGPDVPLRARPDADDVPEADVRQADPDLADDRARPRALHPLLPLHALLARRRRGRPARRAQPRRRSR